jgi:1-phosphofructokinase family hexose kinase
VTRPPILCVSANPALDRRLRLQSLNLGEVNRAQNAQVLPGGKSAHVAMAARALGAQAVWVGFLGGPAGEQCAKALQDLHIEVVPIPTSSPTRVNLEVIEESGRITEVLEPGQAPDEKEIVRMISVLAEGLSKRWNRAPVVISGSLPAGMPSSFYADIITLAAKSGSKVFLDTSGDALPAGLAAKPDFVKPNRREAEALLGRRVFDFASAVSAVADLIERGAASAAVTLGAEGMVWLESKKGPAWTARPPRLQAVSTVGCGDATLAGFAYASLEGMTGEKAIRLAAACGAANCLAQWEGRISPKDVEALLPQIEIATW